MINGVEIYLKREDAIHPDVSGNKFRKLKYNLLDISDNQSVLTFGGAYSNHIVATAKACEMLNFKAIGVIRGDELGKDLAQTLAQNQSLKTANDAGMQLHFVSRQDYLLKEEIPFVRDLMEKNELQLIPEGGTNQKAILGCQEIMTEKDRDFDYITCALGTAGTFSGLLEAAWPHQHLIGFPALKGNFFKNEINKYTQRSNFTLQTKYHFGGYAKYNMALIDFINWFKKTYQVQLDPVYTGKMMYGLFEMIKTNQFPKNTRILAVHTGGLQGIEGFNAKLRLKSKHKLI